MRMTRSKGLWPKSNQRCCHYVACTVNTGYQKVPFECLQHVIYSQCPWFKTGKGSLVHVIPISLSHCFLSATKCPIKAKIPHQKNEVSVGKHVCSILSQIEKKRKKLKPLSTRVRLVYPVSSLEGSRSITDLQPDSGSSILIRPTRFTPSSL